MHKHEEIKALASEIKLANIKENYLQLIDYATNQNLSYTDFLLYVLEEENLVRTNNGISKKIKNAKFPYKRFFHELDLSLFNTEIVSKIKELENLSFIDNGRNVVLIGNPGVGKTHLAIALGMLTCEARKTVLYISIPNLITELKEAMTLNQLTNYKRKFMHYDLVILDELGYISFDKVGSELLFNILSQHSETKSIIITSNILFNKWSDIFVNPIITTALVDKLTHKAYIINIKCDSY
ncbi:MAG: IS21-like element helper ATPase IstB, partial [Erysipelotrichaceae bacterium]